MRGRGTDTRVQCEGLRVVRAAEAHLEALLVMVGTSAEGPGWPTTVWRRLLAPDEGAAEQKIVWLATDAGGSIAGWLAANHVLDRSELEFVLVRGEERGRGVGLRLAEHWLQWAREQGAREAWLEVRASNTAAIGLYRELGFAEQGRRRRYFREPAEDAVLMGLTLRI